jgi:deoxyribonuclease-1
MTRIIIAILIALTTCCRHDRPKHKPKPKRSRFGLPRAHAASNPVRSFSSAKRSAARIYDEHRVTFYCACDFDAARLVDHRSCGYKPQSPGSARAGRIEWEHVVPASAFGRSFSEWRSGSKECVDRRNRPYKGRKCAQHNAQFRAMEGDLHNLVPAIGEVNQHRSDREPGMIDGESRGFGACDIEFAGGEVEPRPDIRGDVARIYQYMHQTYPGRGIISRSKQKLYDAWSRADPVDAWECRRARVIKGVQGNANHVVEAACKQAGL